MAEVLPLSESELRLLESLLRHKIRFMVVGLSAAALQGAPVYDKRRPRAMRRSQVRLSVRDQRYEFKRGSDAVPAPSDIDRQDGVGPQQVR